jgi:hypothetical protein
MTQPVMQYDNKVIPHSTPLTLRWLSENYEFAEGVCIPRSVIYKHYRDFCQKNGMTPVNPASFGKVRNYATSNNSQWSGTAELLPHGLIVTWIGRDP